MRHVSKSFPYYFALFVVAAGAVGFYFYLREPRYDDKPLSYWREAAVNAWIKSGAEWDGHPPSPNVPATEAEKAVKEIGALAIPYLLEDLRYHVPRWKRLAPGFLIDWNIIHLDEDPNDAHFYFATVGFQLLGTNALLALPELTQMLHDPKTSGKTASVLLSIGDPGFPILKESLFDPDPEVRCAAVDVITAYHNHRPELGPTMLKLAQDADPRVRGIAFCALSGCNIKPEVAVPILIQALSDTNTAARYDAINNLGSYGRDAVAALPALTNLLNEANTAMTPKVIRAMEAIRSENLGKSGVY